MGCAHLRFVHLWGIAMQRFFISSVLLLVLTVIAPAHAQDLAPGTVFTDCEGCPEMVVVPAGTFMMGTAPGVFGAENNERPQHQVTIGYDFAVGRYEITISQYREFIEQTGHQSTVSCSGRIGGSIGIQNSARNSGSWQNPGYSLSEELPVSCLEWVDAYAYVVWLSSKSEFNYRLLSESEWEYSARAGSETRYPWGDQFRHEYANYAGTGSTDTWQNRPAPVGSFAANAFGIFDMHGNIWEWVQDCAYSSYAHAPADGSPNINEGCDFRSVRGGSWDDHPRDIRSARRMGIHNNSNSLATKHETFGFRVARDLTPVASPNEEEPEQ